MFSNFIIHAGRKFCLRILASSGSHLGFCLEYCEGTVNSIVYNVVFTLGVLGCQDMYWVLTKQLMRTTHASVLVKWCY